MSHFLREHERYPVELAVRMSCASWTDYLELYTTNLSRGGLFVASETVAPVGSEMTVELLLPDGALIKLRAEVVHVTDEAHEQTPGMGVMFFDVEDETKQALISALEQAQQQLLQAQAEAMQPISDAPPVAPPPVVEPPVVEPPIEEPPAAELQPPPPPAPAIPADDEVLEAQALPPPIPAEASRAPKFGDAVEQALQDELGRRTGLSPAEQLGVAPEAKEAEVAEAHRKLRERYAPTIFARYGLATRVAVRSIDELIDEAHAALTNKQAPPPAPAPPLPATPTELTPEQLEQKRRGDEARQLLRAGIERRVDEARGYRDMGRIDEAIRAFEAVLMLDRKHEMAREELARLRELKAKKKR